MSNRQIINKRLLLSLLVGVCMLLLLAACGKSNNEEEGSTASPKESSNATKQPESSSNSGSPAKVSIMLPQYTTEAPKPDNPGILKIEEHTGVDLDLIWVPGEAYDDKLNATMASGGLPQVITVLDNKDGNIVNGVRSGMFWEIGPYIQDYPNLSKIKNEVYSNISVDGKVYGLPRSRPISRPGVIFRKDWLDALELKAPESIDDIYTILKAFTTQDPDKNGKPDTFGWSTSQYGFDTLSILFGAPNIWGVKDGKIVPSFKTPEYLEAMKFQKKLYDEKLINQDFLIVNDGFLNYMNQGKTGMLLVEMDAVTTARFNDLKKLDPKAELDIISPISGPHGTFTVGGQGFGGVVMFPKTSIKTEEELKMVLQFYDKLGDEAIQDMTKYGVEGNTYKMENGVPNVNLELYNADINPLNQVMVQFGLFDAKLGDKPMETKWKNLIVENEKYAVYDPTVPLISKTFTEKGAQLQTEIEDARNKFLIGELDEAGWNKAIETWSNNGGKQIEEEFTADYAKSQN
ncbi:extracellular solute-binding protein [Paenibacillus eucommiae]|uniref:Aldouronate transport system substrate-binding protein n=1 Tax=Paenibacillus eucommiae TaxID=1355755 RepID=A0ABS4IVT4_9BACL|nr:extracellular solute-binding protein [Paenibacillus eucommiae]MBP1991702.1 putative aldouronate transport system substrate-binding protein [Paenibacillus eucommiae]